MNFNQCIEHVLGSEGGFTDDPDDAGNWTGGEIGKGKLKGTKWGISAATYPNLDIKNLTRQDAINIYYRDFWVKFKVASYPEKIRLHFFDVCVNSGNSRAVKILQRAVGGLVVDGIAGPATMKAASRVDVWSYHDERNEFYIIYAEQKPVVRKYLNGWIRRVSKVTRISVL